MTPDPCPPLDATMPPVPARVAALGPAVLGLLLEYVGFFLHGAVGGNHSTLASLYFAWTLLLGLALLLVAPSIAKARDWAVFVGGALSLVGAASSALLLARGAFAAVFGVALGLASVVVLSLALPGCVRVARARRELAALHPEVLLARREGRSDLLGVLVAFAVLAGFAGAFWWCSPRTSRPPTQGFAAPSSRRCPGARAVDVGRSAASLVRDEIRRGSRLSHEDAVAIDDLLAQRAANEQAPVKKGLTLRSRQRLRFTASTARSLRRYDDFVITQLLKGARSWTTRTPWRPRSTCWRPTKRRRSCLGSPATRRGTTARARSWADT